MFEFEADEWRQALRGMTETDRTNTDIAMRQAAGINPYDDDTEGDR